MRKLLSILLTVTFCISFAPLFAVNAEAASSKIWNGKADTSWFTGKKESYDISTPEELAGLAKLVNKGNSMEGVIINLKSDLTMNNTKGWQDWFETPPKNKFTPIGHSGDPVSGYFPFSGIFNGNGHTIKGLYINSGRTAGLFGYVYCGGVSSVIIRESIIVGYDNGKGKGVYSGGIAGIVEGGVIAQCENSGIVYSQGKNDAEYGDREAYAGGIAGSLQTENMNGVAAELLFIAGGWLVNPVLFNDGSGGPIKESGIVNCISSGTVRIFCGTTGYLGGIVGWGNNGVVKNCVVWNGYKWQRGKTGFGGYVGRISVGRICGGVYSCRTENCYYYDYGDKFTGIGENMSSTVLGKVKDNAVCKTGKQMMTKEFIKALGEAYAYAKNDRPYLCCDVNRPDYSSDSGKKDKPAVTVNAGKAVIKWNKVDGAVSYIVYKKQSNGKYERLVSTKKTKVTLNNISEGVKYELLIKAKFDDDTTKTIPNGKFSFVG